MGVDSGIGDNDILSQAKNYALLVFECIAIYSSIELFFIIFGTFKRYSGCYFWSFLVATAGIPVYSIAFILMYQVHSCPFWVFCTLILFGWPAMVTGQSMVLWSRLHLVVRHTTVLRFVLYMIIFDAIICHVPILVMLYGSNSPNPGRWVVIYSIYEKIQISIFFVQEVIISSIYVWQTVKLLGPSSAMHNRKRPRALMIHLIIVNVAIIGLDITILGLEYAGLYAVQTSYKAFVYSIKLKLEFTILNKLVEMTGSGGRNSQSLRATDTESNSNSNSRPAARRNPSLLDTSIFGSQAQTTWEVRGGSVNRDVELPSPLAAARTADRGVVRTTEVRVQTEKMDEISDEDASPESPGSSESRRTREEKGDGRRDSFVDIKECSYSSSTS